MKSTTQNYTTQKEKGPYLDQPQDMSDMGVCRNNF